MRAALVLVLLAACGDDGDAVSLQDAGDLFRSEYCTYLARCGVVGSQAECLELNIGIGVHLDPSLVAAVDAGKIAYDGGLLRSCYGSIGSTSCDRTAESARRFGNDDCYGTTVGTVGAGGACAIDQECISESCDVPSCPNQCCQGTCVGAATAPPPYQIGEACTGAQCASGSYCDSTSKVCAALKPAAAACTSATECAYGLGCAGTPRTCQALPTLGQACPDGQCRDAGTICNTAKVCAKVGLVGDACTVRADCSIFYTCDATMHCAPGPHEGESCANNTRCADYDTFCDSATSLCKAPQPDGASCTASSQCTSNYCTGPGSTTMTCQIEPVCI